MKPFPRVYPARPAQAADQGPAAPQSEPTSAQAPEILFVTGLSGAGQSTVMDALEDHDWFVVRNLRPALFRPMIDFTVRLHGAIRLALMLDVRSPGALSDFGEHLAALRASGFKCTVLFLDATDEAVESRFIKEGRPHPVPAGELGSAIVAERRMMRGFRDAADLIIDTTQLNTHTLSTTVAELFSEEGVIVVRISVMSFGFKYGLPLDADYVADVRFLPNPHWIEDLRPLDGRNKDVSDYVLSADGARTFLQGYALSLQPVIEGYRRENKHYATVAVGCTGGKHRSVAMSMALEQHLAAFPHVRTSVHHRDVGRD